MAAEGLIPRAFELYSANPFLRPLIALIPVVGSAVDVGISTRAQNIVYSRLKTLLDQLAEEFQRLHESALREDYFHSEEWFDLAITAIERTVRTRSRDKIRRFAKLLAGAINGKGAHGFDTEQFLQIADALSDKEFEVAAAIAGLELNRSHSTDNVYGRATIGSWLEIGADCPNVVEEEWDSILLKLQSLGLIKEQTGAFLDYTGGAYTATALLMAFVTYIRE